MVVQYVGRFSMSFPLALSSGAFLLKSRKGTLPLYERRNVTGSAAHIVRRTVFSSQEKTCRDLPAVSDSGGRPDNPDEFFSAQFGNRRGQPRNRYAWRRARHVIQADVVAEADCFRMPALLTADTDL